MANSSFRTKRQTPIPPGDGRTGSTGLTGATGATGATGPGVPIGGATGTILNKASATDLDTAWLTRATLAGDAAFSALYAPIALGRVAAPVTVVTDQTGITALTDLTGFSITFTVVTGRFYEVTWHFLSAQLTSTATQLFKVSLDGTEVIIGNVVQAAGGINVNGGSMHFLCGAASGNVPSVTAGSRVIKLRGSTSAGTMNISNGGTMNGKFVITDIGPNP